MGLQDEIDTRRAQISTDEYSMSFGELSNIYLAGEMDIHPEFQRYFRWTDTQKTRLIESILLGIPIPPIFVAQQRSGLWDVVDGLQRLSTVFQLFGILRDDENELVPALILEGTDDLPSLKGKHWDNPDEDEANSLTQAQKLIIKRSRIGISIILSDSDPRAKFELFQRLNTGGSPATDQEVRNSILTAANRDMYKWLQELANDENFREATSLSERALAEQYDLELVLRYIVFRNLPLSELSTTNIGDLSVFLTREMLRIANDFTTEYVTEETRSFRRTFEILNKTTSDNSFRRYDPVKQKFLGAFLVTPYEVVAFGIGANYSLWSDNEFHKIEPRVKQIWSTSDIINTSGSGIAANRRIAKVVPIGRQLFKP